MFVRTCADHALSDLFTHLSYYFPLFITCLSSFDAIHVSKWSKLGVSIAVALVATVFTVYFQCFTSKDDDVYVQFTATQSVSMLSTISSGLRY